MLPTLKHHSIYLKSTENGDQEVSKSGLIFPSFVRVIGRLIDSYGGRPLRDVNLVRVTAVMASIAVIIGIGVSIGLICLDIIKWLI